MTLFRLPMLDRWWNPDPYRRAEERRLSYRYPALDPTITVGWWSGEKFHTCPGMVLNISLGGAAVQADQWPEAAETIVLKNGEAADPGSWVDVDLLNGGSRRRVRRGKFLLHLKFPKSCPYDFFTRVTAGDSRDSLGNLTGPETNSFNWR